MNDFRESIKSIEVHNQLPGITEYGCNKSVRWICLQIDSTMMKNLDANLFLGDEIREVYTEIMKTVPRDHLDCEQVKLDVLTI